VPAMMCPAMQDDGMQPRVTSQHLPLGAGGGIARHDVGDVFTDVAEHKGIE
jgi:hypothetical protein